jgi:hypothetical protein
MKKLSKEQISRKVRGSVSAYEKRHLIRFFKDLKDELLKLLEYIAIGYFEKYGRYIPRDIFINDISCCYAQLILRESLKIELSKKDEEEITNTL